MVMLAEHDAVVRRADSPAHPPRPAHPPWQRRPGQRGPHLDRSGVADRMVPVPEVRDLTHERQPGHALLEFPAIRGCTYRRAEAGRSR